MAMKPVVGKLSVMERTAVSVACSEATLQRLALHAAELQTRLDAVQKLLLNRTERAR